MYIHLEYKVKQNIFFLLLNIHILGNTKSMNVDYLQSKRKLIVSLQIRVVDSQGCFL